jgi:hypothetical protein
MEKSALPGTVLTGSREPRPCHAAQAGGTASATQTAMRAHPRGDATFWRAKLYDFGEARRSSKKSKKNIDIHGRNLVRTRMSLKQTKDFCPVGFFVCLESSDQKTK